MTTDHPSSVSHAHAGHDPDHPVPKPSEQSVLETLEELLMSPPFRNTNQLQTLLRYVVRHTLEGNDALLRERVIGAEIFGRRAAYDTNDDPIVRIRMAETRKRLAQAYQGFEVLPPLVISIPTGSYKAKFSPHMVHAEVKNEAAFPLAHVEEEPTSHPEVALVTPDILPAKAVESGRRVSGKTAALSLGVLALVAVTVAIGIRFFSPERSYQEFWAPYTKSPRPTLLVLGSNAVYRLTGEFSDQYASAHGLLDQGMEFVIEHPDEALTHGGLLPAANSFVALGDVASISTIVAALTSQGQSFENRFQNDISFAEVRKSPTILVGGFNNPIARELTKNLHFVMVDRHHLVNRQNPNQNWQVWPAKSSYDNTEDYAILTRLRGETGNPQMVVAGMGQYGTLAAAEFVTQPESIKMLVKQLGPSWKTQNFQAVLHIDVRDFKPTETRILAVYTW